MYKQQSERLPFNRSYGRGDDNAAHAWGQIEGVNGHDGAGLALEDIGDSEWCHDFDCARSETQNGS